MKRDDEHDKIRNEKQNEIHEQTVNHITIIIAMWTRADYGELTFRSNFSLYGHTNKRTHARTNLLGVGLD